MKLIFTFAIILTFAFVTFGQNDPTKLSDSEKKRLKQEEKEYKEKQKEKLKHPAQVVINAPSEMVKSIIVRTFSNYNYTLVNETPRILSFTRDLKGFGESMAGAVSVGTTGGSRPQMAAVATINEVGGFSTVIVNVGLVSDNIFGKTNSASLNQNKKIRSDLDDILSRIKKEAEERYIKSKPEQK